MKNRTTSQTTGPDKKDKRTTYNTTPGIKNPAVSSMEMRSIMDSMKKGAMEGGIQGMIKNSIMDPMKKGAMEGGFQGMIKNSIMDPMKKGAMEGGFQGMTQYYNNIPFKNNAIDVLNRRKYDISSEFDGQEVQGTMTERPTFGGGMVETERYNMPGGGSRMERTRFNAEGQPVKRVIRDNKINPR